MMEAGTPSGGTLWSGLCGESREGEVLTRTTGVFVGFFTYSQAHTVPRVPRTARLSRAKVGRTMVVARSAKKGTWRVILLGRPLRCGSGVLWESRATAREAAP